MLVKLPLPAEKVRLAAAILSTPAFALHPALDADSLAKRFSANGRVRVVDFLAPDAAFRLGAALQSRQDWLHLINSGDTVFELDRATRQGFTPARAQALDDAVYDGARAGFQYRFEAIRVPDDHATRSSSKDILAAFAEWMSGDEVLGFLRHVTGEATISFADAQATAYGPGDFLTAHDDVVPGKSRRAAYVLGLTPVWRVEWGGLLIYHGTDGVSFEGVGPSFNTLDLFRVPATHSVSLVSAASAHRRYSITGWLRDRKDEL